MRQQRVYPSVQITAKAERLVKQGHPWIYGAELKSRQEPPGKRRADRCICRQRLYGDRIL